MKETKVGIIGATGYVGVELVRLFSLHPYVRLTHLVSKSYAGKKFSDIYPAFRGVCDLILTDSTPEQVAENCDFVITALPHGVSSVVVPVLLEKGVKVIDHSGDFRYRTLAPYTESYGLTHPCPELLASAVYGLPELYRDKLSSCVLAADPGCYPTCSILGIAPLLKKNLVSAKGLIIDAVSGYSGAGRKADLPYSFCEATESFKAYSLLGHRHTTEIEQECSFLANEPVVVTFTPHLAPMKRGMYATIYADLSPEFAEMRDEDIHLAYDEYYKEEPFVRVLPRKAVPETKNVSGSNFIDIAIFVDRRTNKVKITSALDNMGKGSASQAVQTLNVMQGYPETTGLATLCSLL